MACIYFTAKKLDVDAEKLGDFVFGQEVLTEGKVSHVRGKEYVIRVPVTRGRYLEHAVDLSKPDATRQLVDKINKAVAALKERGVEYDKLHVELAPATPGLRIPSDDWSALQEVIALAALGDEAVDPRVREVREYVRKLSGQDLGDFRTLLWAAIDAVRSGRRLTGELREHEKKALNESGLGTEFGVEQDEQRTMRMVPGRMGGSRKTVVEKLRNAPEVRDVFDRLVRERTAGAENVVKAEREARNRLNEMLDYVGRWMLVEADYVEEVSDKPTELMKEGDEVGSVRQVPVEEYEARRKVETSKTMGRIKAERIRKAYVEEKVEKQASDPQEKLEPVKVPQLPTDKLPGVQGKLESSRIEDRELLIRLRDIAEYKTDKAYERLVERGLNALSAFIAVFPSDVKNMTRLIEELTTTPVPVRYGQKFVRQWAKVWGYDKPRAVPLFELVEGMEQRLGLKRGDLSYMLRYEGIKWSIETPYDLALAIALYTGLVRHTLGEFDTSDMHASFSGLFETARKKLEESVELNIDPDKPEKEGTLNYERAPLQRSLIDVLRLLNTQPALTPDRVRDSILTLGKYVPLETLAERAGYAKAERADTEEAWQQFRRAYRDAVSEWADEHLLLIAWAAGWFKARREITETKQLAHAVTAALSGMRPGHLKEMPETYGATERKRRVLYDDAYVVIRKKLTEFNKHVKMAQKRIGTPAAEHDAAKREVKALMEAYKGKPVFVGKGRDFDPELNPERPVVKTEWTRHVEQALMSAPGREVTFADLVAAARVAAKAAKGSGEKVEDTLGALLNLAVQTGQIDVSSVPAHLRDALPMLVWAANVLRASDLAAQASVNGDEAMMQAVYRFMKQGRETVVRVLKKDKQLQRAMKRLAAVVFADSIPVEQKRHVLQLLLSAPEVFVRVLSGDTDAVRELKMAGYNVGQLEETLTAAAFEAASNSRTDALVEVLSGDAPPEWLDRELFLRHLTALGFPLEQALEARRALLAGWDVNDTRKTLDMLAGDDGVLARMVRLQSELADVATSAGSGVLDEGLARRQREVLRELEEARNQAVSFVTLLRRNLRRDMAAGRRLTERERLQLVDVARRAFEARLHEVRHTGLRSDRNARRMHDLVAEMVTLAVRSHGGGLLTHADARNEGTIKAITTALTTAARSFKRAYRALFGAAERDDARWGEVALRWLADSMQLRLTRGVDGQPYLLTPGEVAEGALDAQSANDALAEFIMQDKIAEDELQARTAAEMVRSVAEQAIDALYPRQDDPGVQRTTREYKHDEYPLDTTEEPELRVAPAMTGEGASAFSYKLDSIGVRAPNGRPFIHWFVERLKAHGLLGEDADPKQTLAAVNRYFPFQSWGVHTLYGSGDKAVLRRMFVYRLKKSRDLALEQAQSFTPRVATTPEELFKQVDFLLERAAKMRGAQADERGAVRPEVAALLAAASVGGLAALVGAWPAAAAVAIATGGGALTLYARRRNLPDRERAVEATKGGLVHKTLDLVSSIFSRPTQRFNLMQEKNKVERKAYHMVHRAAMESTMLETQFVQPALVDLARLVGRALRQQEVFIVRSPADLNDPARALSYLLTTIPTEAFERVSPETLKSPKGAARLWAAAKLVLDQAAQDKDVAYDVASVHVPDPIMIETALAVLGREHLAWIYGRAVPLMKEFARLRGQHLREMYGERSSFRGAPIPLVMMGVGAYGAALNEATYAASALRAATHAPLEDLKLQLQELAARYTQGSREKLIDELAELYGVKRNEYLPELEAMADHLQAVGRVNPAQLPKNHRLYTAYFLRHMTERGTIPNVFHFIDAEARSVQRTIIHEPAVLRATLELSHEYVENPRKAEEIAEYMQSILDDPTYMAFANRGIGTLAKKLRNLGYFRQMWGSLYQLSQDLWTLLMMPPSHPHVLAAAKETIKYAFFGHDEAVTQAIHAIADRNGIGNASVPRWSEHAGMLEVAYKLLGHRPDAPEYVKQAEQRVREVLRALDGTTSWAEMRKKLGEKKDWVVALGDFVAMVEYLQQRLAFFGAIYGYTREAAREAGYDFRDGKVVLPDGTELHPYELFVHAYEGKEQGMQIEGIDAEDIVRRAIVEIDQTFALYANANMAPFERAMRKIPVIGEGMTMFSTFVYNQLNVMAHDFVTMVGMNGGTKDDRVRAAKRFFARNAALAFFGGQSAFKAIINLFLLGAIGNALKKLARMSDTFRERFYALFGGDPEEVIPTSTDDPRWRAWEERVEELTGVKDLFRNPFVALANKALSLAGTDVQLPVPELGTRYALEFPYSAAWRSAGRENIPWVMRVMLGPLADTASDAWVLLRHDADSPENAQEYKEAWLRLFGPRAAAAVTGDKYLKEARWPMPFSTNPLMTVGAYRTLWFLSMVTDWAKGKVQRSALGPTVHPAGEVIDPAQAFVVAFVSSTAWQQKARERIRWGAQERKAYAEAAYMIGDALAASLAGDNGPLRRLNDTLWQKIPVRDPETGKLLRARKGVDWGPVKNVHPFLANLPLEEALERVVERRLVTGAQARMIHALKVQREQALLEGLDKLRGFLREDGTLDAWEVLEQGDSDTRVALMVVLSVLGRGGTPIGIEHATAAQRRALGLSDYEPWETGEGTPRP